MQHTTASLPSSLASYVMLSGIWNEGMGEYHRFLDRQGFAVLHDCKVKKYSRYCYHYDRAHRKRGPPQKQFGNIICVSYLCTAWSQKWLVTEKFMRIGSSPCSSPNPRPSYWELRSSVKIVLRLSRKLAMSWHHSCLGTLQLTYPCTRWHQASNKNLTSSHTFGSRLCEGVHITFC